MYSLAIVCASLNNLNVRIYCQLRDKFILFSKILKRDYNNFGKLLITKTTHHICKNVVSNKIKLNLIKCIA